MIHLLQSIWLWAIAGIVVPLFIHLWNVKKGKTLKVGSIAFLMEAARSHSKSFRISDRLLLLLRCLLLILLAILLASPFFEQQDNAVKEKGWILAEKKEAKTAYRFFTATIDSLLKAGYVFHYFNKGFPEGVISDAFVDIDAGKNDSTSYWTRLQQLDQQVPSALPIYLFTGNRLDRFSGTRPSVALDLHWKTYIADTTRPGSLSRPDTGLSVCIYTDKTGMGVGYVKAALEAIRDLGKRNIRITVADNVQSIPKDNSWLFWLSESTMPATLIKHAVFVYGKGKAEESLSPVITSNKINASNDEVIPGFKIIQHKNLPTEIPVWVNAYGETVLGKEPGAVPIYYFYSRLDPQWNGLVWSARFPQLMHDLLYNTGAKDIEISPAATIDPQQVAPPKRTAANLPLKKYLLRRTDLVTLCWILAFILFFVERLLTYRKKKEVVYG